MPEKSITEILSDKPAAPAQRPSVVRCVHYISLQREPLAALITFVHDDETVNLAVFDTDGRTFAKQRVKMGTEPATWMWPARV